jgi:hypothetical protein
LPKIERHNSARAESESNQKDVKQTEKENEKKLMNENENGFCAPKMCTIETENYGNCWAKIRTIERVIYGDYNVSHLSSSFLLPSAFIAKSFNFHRVFLQMMMNIVMIAN